jgi:predicted RNase H-like nuclease (RuvC/YqgF family)
MDFVLGIKDLILIGTTITTIVGAFFALKYKSEKNKDKTNSTEDSFKAFKEYIYKELKEIDRAMKRFDSHVSELLRKDDAEEKYISRREHNLIIKNIDDKIGLILKAVQKEG